MMNGSAPTPDAVPTVCPGEDMRECGPDAGTQREREEMARAVLSVVMDSHYAGAVTDKLIALGYRKPAAPDAPGSPLAILKGRGFTEDQIMAAAAALGLAKVAVAAAPDAPTPESIDGISMSQINLLREIAQRGIKNGLRCNYRPTPRTLLALANVAARALAPESRPSEASQVQREGKCSCAFGHGDGDWLSRNCPVHGSSSVQPEGTDAKYVIDCLSIFRTGESDSIKAMTDRCIEIVSQLAGLHHVGDGKRGSSAQRGISDEVRKLLQNIAKGYRWSAKARRDMADVPELGNAAATFNARLADGFEAEAKTLEDFLADSTAAGYRAGPQAVTMVREILRKFTCSGGLENALLELLAVLDPREPQTGVTLFEARALDELDAATAGRCPQDGNPLGPIGEDGLRRCTVCRFSVKVAGAEASA
jgi:hypothetical protein